MALSTGRCNASLKFVCRSVQAERLARTVPPVQSLATVFNVMSAIGVGRRTGPDLAMHSFMLVTLVFGLVAAREPAKPRLLENHGSYY